MEEAKASWTVLYETPDGFQPQITLREGVTMDDVKLLLQVARQTLDSMKVAECKPVAKGGRFTSPAAPSGQPSGESHFCTIHKVAMFKRGKMKDYAHPVDLENGDTGWCDGKEMRIGAKR